jgi:hypothetical protein
MLLGRNLHNLCNTVHDLIARGVGLEVLTCQGAAIDTTTAAGKLGFGIVAALAEFERMLVSERTVAVLVSARARGRMGGRPFTMTPAKVRLAAASTGKPETNGAELCNELGVSRQTLYRNLSPTGDRCPHGQRAHQEQVSECQSGRGRRAFPKAWIRAVAGNRLLKAVYGANGTREGSGPLQTRGSPSHTPHHRPPTRPTGSLAPGHASAWRLTPSRDMPGNMDALHDEHM